MFKRIMKILGIVLGGFVVIVGAFFGVTALTGGFEEKTVHLRKVYFDGDETNTEKVVYTLSSQTFTIDYSPLDTTNKNLTVQVEDPVGVLDNAPETVVAGKPFTLNIRKDEKGNNIAGGVYLKIGRDQAWVDIYMQVDVAIPDNVLYFAGNTNDKLTASGKKFTLARSTLETNVYLKSELVNAFNVSFEGGENIKSALIDYTYYDLEGSPIETKTPEYFSNLDTSFVRDSVTNTVSYFFKVPVIPRESGKIKMNAKMHRTYEIEKAYNEGKFYELETLIRNNGTQNTAVRTMLHNFNVFLNTYMQYFDRTSTSYEWFKQYIKNDGTIEIDTLEGVVGAHDFIFVSCSAEIEVTAVNLQKIASKATITTYDVFDSVNLAKSDSVQVGDTNALNILDEYDLKLTLDNGEEISNYDNAVAGLYDELTVDAYMYVKTDTAIENATAVYGFLVDSNEALTYQPITQRVWESFSIEEKAQYVQYGYIEANEDLTLNEDTIIGYLIPLKGNTQYNFIEVNPLKATSGKNYWQVNFNVPLDQPADESQIYKALYLGFKVRGYDLKNNVDIVRESYSRVTINYTPYDIKDGQYLKLSSLDGNNNNISLKSKMALNSNLSPSSLGSNYANNQQIINMDLASNVNNAGQLQYTNVMYFAESTSNKTESSDKKIFTLGKYKFIGMDDVEYSLGENQVLEGERIPVSKIAGVQAGVNNPVIYGLNASDEPVKVFAVVYLSDKSGRPIDLNGRVINIDETVEEEPYGIYVIAISNYLGDAGNIYIDSFVDNINYYTKVSTEVDASFKFGDYKLDLTSDYLKRNNVTELIYEDDEGEEQALEGEAFKAYQEFIALKLIQGMPLTVEITNMDKGESTEKEKIELDAIGINGKTLRFEPEQNVSSNKQIAFNNMCKHFNTDYRFNCDDNIEILDTTIVGEEGAYSAITFKVSIKATAKAEDIDGTTGILYVGPNIGNNEDDYRGVLPFSETLTSSRSENQVTYIKNTLKITGVGDVQFTDEDSVETGSAIRYNELLAKYSPEEGVHDGTLKFGIDNPPAWDSYSIPKISELSILPVEVMTNLHPKPVDAEQDEVQKQYNYDIVDISQSLEGQDEESSENIISTLIYNSVTSNNLKLDFIMPTHVAILQDNVIFTNNTDNGVTEGTIYIGSTKVSYSGSTVIVANKEYELKENEKYSYIEIPKGTYFPVVEELVLGESGNYETKQYVMMLDEKFEVISKGDGLVISTTEATSVKDERAIVITDKINDRNETLANYINGSNGEFNFIKGSSNGTDAFLILNIGFLPQGANSSDCKFNFQKLFTYSLKQNPVELVGHNNGAVNSEDNRLEIQGGETVTLYLNTQTEPYIYNENDGYVFNHIKYEILTENISFIDAEGREVRVLEPGSIQDSVLKLKANICGDNQTASIRLSYVYQGEVQTFDYYLYIIRNYTFTNKSDVGCTLSGNIFKLELPEGSYKIYDESDVNALISKYFTTENIKGVELLSKNTSIGENLVISENFAVQGNENITKESLTYQIKIQLLDGTFVTLPQTLNVVLTPTVIIDALQVTNNLNTVLLGTSIYDYVSLYTYENNGKGTLIDASNTKYDNILFEITSYTIGSGEAKTNGTDGITYSIVDGIITGPINSQNVTLTFKITYPTNLNNAFIIGSIVVEGIKIYYSPTGTYTQDNAEVNDIELINGTTPNVNVDGNSITIYLLSNQDNILLFNYIAIKSVTGGDPLYAFAKTPTNGFNNTINKGVEYQLWYAKQTAGGIEYAKQTIYTIKFVVVEMYYDTTGAITDDTTQLALNGKEFVNQSMSNKLSDLNITVADSEEIDLAKYIKVFAGETEISFAIKQAGGSNYVTKVTSGTTNSELTYNVYVYAGTGDKFDTGYTLTIKITISND